MPAALAVPPPETAPSPAPARLTSPVPARPASPAAVVNPAPKRVLKLLPIRDPTPPIQKPSRPRASKPRQNSPPPVPRPSKQSKALPDPQIISSDSEANTKMDAPASEESASDRSSSPPRHPKTKKGKQVAGHEDESGSKSMKTAEPSWKHRRPANPTGKYHTVLCSTCIWRKIRCEIEAGGGVCVACYKGKIKCDQSQRNDPESYRRTSSSNKRQRTHAEISSESEEEPRESTTGRRGAGRTRGRPQQRRARAEEEPVSKGKKRVPSKAKRPALQKEVTSSDGDGVPVEDEARHRTKSAPKKRRVSAPSKQEPSSDEESSEPPPKISKRVQKKRKLAAQSNRVPKPPHKDSSNEEPLADAARGDGKPGHVEAPTAQQQANADDSE